ncbi:MAG: galactokinase [Clostridia bacterium]|nr:galactokinase [Clostridia bacterium]
MKQKVLEAFKTAYGDTDGARVFFAPGRVNLIGEHTDYNGGHVFPCALTIGTYAAVRKRDDTKCRFYSANFPETGVVERDINDTENDETKGFTNYPLGVIYTLKFREYNIDKGLDIAYLGNIPNSSGLSSSASVEVLTGYFLKVLFDLDISNQDIALVGQEAENDFIGVSCGIMDQFIIAMGKKGHATFLDTATLDFKYVPVDLKGAKLVIACSNKKRGLADSKYNMRRMECEEAVADLSHIKQINHICDLNTFEFDQLKPYIKREVCRKRAAHAVYENQRTIKAKAALENGDIEYFGKLMNESHRSLRDDYEVTGKELDTLVETAWKQEGVIGSRMTGAGFGGCTVSIVKDDCVDSFIEMVGRIYEATIGYKADFYVVEIGDGPTEL